MNHVFDEWVVNSQTEDAVWIDKIIQMHNFCDTSPSSVELHCTYLGISGCHAIVAHKINVAEQYIQVSDTLVTMMCGWSCLPHPVLLLSVSSWTSVHPWKLGWGWLALIRMPGNEVQGEAWFSEGEARIWSGSGQLSSRSWSTWSKSFLSGAPGELARETASGTLFSPRWAQNVYLSRAVDELDYTGL